MSAWQHRSHLPEYVRAGMVLSWACLAKSPWPIWGRTWSLQIANWRKRMGECWEPCFYLSEGNQGQDKELQEGNGKESSWFVYAWEAVCWAVGLMLIPTYRTCWEEGGAVEWPQGKEIQIFPLSLVPNIVQFSEDVLQRMGLWGLCWTLFYFIFFILLENGDFIQR
jgi:hypothetical protein